MSDFRKRLLIVGGNDRSLWANRGDLMQELLNGGWTLRAVLPPPEASAPEPWFDVPIRRIPLRRTGMNPVADMAAVMALRREIRSFEPSVVFAYNPKPVVYAGIALKGLPSSRLVSMVTGRGPLVRRPGLKGALAFGSLRALYGMGLARADVVLFQNNDDRTYFEERWPRLRRIPRDVVPGSGVNLERFPRHPVPPGPPRFLFIGKLLIDKGIREFVAAARSVRKTHPESSFRVVGDVDRQLPHAISGAEYEAWKREGLLEFAGRVDDVRPHLAWCSVLCHPSYAEGTPRAVLEAMSTGRPVITTDAPGCRQTVKEGVTGFLIPPRDAGALAERMQWFASNPAAADAMAKASWEYAQGTYDVRRVNLRIIDHIDSVMHSGG